MPKTNGIDKVPPQPAPRKLTPSSSIASDKNDIHKPLTLTNSASSEADENQVHSRPITNEEFQAMIPEHFLHPKTNTSPNSSEKNGPTVTVTINNPNAIGDGINFPPAPTQVGKVTEVITKSTFTETVVTRVTDNQFVQPLISEVSTKCKFCFKTLTVFTSFITFYFNPYANDKILCCVIPFFFVRKISILVKF